jgi:ABC-type sugar transport system ATPase subunit
VLDLIKRLREAGEVSIVMILHNFVHVFQACDRLNLINDGEIVLDKPTSESSVEELTEVVVKEFRPARRHAGA